MEYIVMVLAGIVGFAVAVGGGLWLGGLIKDRKPWLYWLLNVLVIIIGIVVNFASLMMGWSWLLVGSIAFIGGGLTGLKYGYGRSVGVWKTYDRMMGSDDLPN